MGPKQGPLWDFCCNAEISAGGRFIAFNSRANDLVRGDRNGVTDVFVADVRKEKIERVSVSTNGIEGAGVCSSTQRDSVVDESPQVVRLMEGSGNPSISDNGRYVAFTSCATNLVPDDRNNAADIFVHDRWTDKTQRASVSSSGRETPPDVSSPEGDRDSRTELAHISGNGRFVVFASSSDVLVENDDNGAADIFVRDLRRKKTERVSVSSKGSEGTPDGVNTSVAPAISVDGRYVGFASVLKDLVPDDTNGGMDVFVRDRKRNRTERVSIASDGSQADVTAFQGVPAVIGPVLLSGNGRFVGYGDLAANLVPDDRNRGYDTFVRDRAKRRTTRVSVDSQGRPFRDFVAPDESLWSTPQSMSRNGRYILFGTWIVRQVRDLNDPTCTVLMCAEVIDDYHMHDSKSGETQLLEEVRAFPYPYLANHTVDGRLIAISSNSSKLVKGDTNGIDDVFLRDRGGDVGALKLHRATAGRTTLGTAPFGRTLEGTLIERRDARDLYGEIRLDRVASVHLPRPGVSMAQPPGTTYVISFAVGGRRFEVRLDSITGGGEADRAPLSLFECGSTVWVACRRVGDVAGAYGASGPVIDFAVPFGSLDLRPGGSVHSVQVYAR